MLRVLWVSLVLMFLAGCASTPLEKITASKGDRIGVIVEGGDGLLHSHLGSTVFSNFAKEYPQTNGSLRDEALVRVNRAITDAGFVPVDLTTQAVTAKDFSDVVVKNSGAWSVAPDKESLIRKMRDDLRLRAVLVVRQDRVTAAIECGGGPCNYRDVDAPGLYSRSFFGMNSYYAVAAYRWNFIVFDPLVDAAAEPPVSDRVWVPSRLLKPYKAPADIKNLTESELQPVRDSVLQQVYDTAAEAVATFVIP